MGKRKSHSVSTGIDNKRAKHSLLEIDDSEEPSYQISAKLDPTYGQRSAFPGLDDTEISSELSENDALVYLRNVR
jgi:hypothetical protein